MVGGGSSRGNVRERNAYLRDVGRTQEERGDELGRSVRQICRYDKEDRDRALRDCLTSTAYGPAVIRIICDRSTKSRRQFGDYWDRGQRLKEIHKELGNKWLGSEKAKYAETILAAEIVDDFEGKFKKLVEGPCNLEIGLAAMIGMDTKTRDHAVAQRANEGQAATS